MSFANARTGRFSYRRNLVLLRGALQIAMMFCLLMGSGLHLAYAAPPNDNFANATVLSGNSGSLSGTNTSATKENGEPKHGPSWYTGGASVWHAWTAPSTSILRVDIVTGGFTAFMAVYTGTSISTSNKFPSDDEFGNPASYITFATQAGKTYYIAVDSDSEDSGPFNLKWRVVATPPNDNFADAATITGASGSLSGTLTTDNTLATRETDEPNHTDISYTNTAGKSVWYKWTAPAKGVWQISTAGSDFNTWLVVYKGGSLTSLTKLVYDSQSGEADPSTVLLRAVAGTTYYIAVDSTSDYWSGKAGRTGLIKLNWNSVTPVAPNDDFADAAPLGGTGGSLSGTTTTDNTNATREPGEPNHNSRTPQKSVWYVWTAPTNSVLRVDTQGSSFFASLGVYTGNTVNALTTITSDSVTVSFSATAGTNYYIAVDSSSGKSGPIKLNWRTLVFPSNDDFANALTLSGTSGSLSGTPTTDITLATAEPGEPYLTEHSNDTGKSLWYAWTAPSNGLFHVETNSSDFRAVLGAYTGSSLTALTKVAFSVVGNDPINFRVTAGTKYYIAVYGFDDTGGGLFTLNWAAVDPAPNDDFANAAVISGIRGTLSGTPTTANVYATREPGEPRHDSAHYYPDRNGGKSLWYVWTAQVDGVLQVTIPDSNFYTLLAVYTGNSVDALTEVSYDNAGVDGDLALFKVTANTRYYIAVDGYDGTSGLFTLQWDNLTPPNDNFADAAPLGGASGNLSGTPTTTNVNATLEAGEPPHFNNTGSKSVWYKWTAPYNSVLQVSTTGSNFDTILGVYTGSGFEALAKITENNDTGNATGSFAEFPVTAGTTYYIAVAGRGQEQGLINLSWSLPSVSISDTTVTEGTNSTTYATFIISRSGITTEAASVNYTTADGTAKQVEDYTAQSGTLNFAAGETNQKITIEIRGDGTDEDNETFKVNLSGASNIALGDGQGMATIVDNDALPQLSISDAAVIEGNPAQGAPGTKNAAFTVTLSAPSGRTVTVNAIPSNGSATAPKDYTAGGAKLTFAPGEVSKTFNVPVISDTLSETDETFFVLLASPVNAGLARARAIGTIKNDDAVPGISVADISVQEGHFGTRVAVFTLKLLQSSGQIVKVNYATAPGTATIDADYTAVPSTQIAFGVGATTALARVVIKSDVIDEPNETFKLNLSSPVNATLTDGQAICTITDDDPLPSLSIGNASIVEGTQAGATATKTLAFTVTMTGKTSQAVSVNYATSNGSAAAGSDYVAKTGTLNFAVGESTKLIVVTVNSDRQVEANENFYVLLTNPTNAVIGVGRGTGTITNDDFPPPPPPGVQAPSPEDSE